MKIDSLYITQSAVIGLSNVPLEANENIRKAFEPIFNSKNCFTDAGVNIHNLVCDDTYDNAPFISNMGQLRFNERSVNFFNTYLYDEDLESLLEYEEYNEYREYMAFEEYNVFGCNKELKDQRMNFLYFELYKPFKILAQYGGRTVASGKIFLHVYPAGYIVVHLAVYRRNIRGIEIKTEKDILELIHETKPWIDGKWKWKSKFGCHTLRETFKQVFQNISISLFSEGKMTTGMLEWKAGVAISTDLYKRRISQAIMEANEVVPSFVEVSHNSYREQPTGILVAKSRIHYYFADFSRDRGSILHSFWKINHINEFLLYKNKVYSDYLNYIQKDRNEMRELRLNKKYMFKLANIVGKDFYNDTFISYTQALDAYTKMLGPRYRAIYALFSKVDGFDGKRAKLNQALNDWEEDIKDWNSKDTGIEKLFTFLLSAKDFFSSKK